MLFGVTLRLRVEGLQTDSDWLKTNRGISGYDT